MSGTESIDSNWNHLQVEYSDKGQIVSLFAATDLLETAESLGEGANSTDVPHLIFSNPLIGGPE